MAYFTYRLQIFTLRAGPPSPSYYESPDLYTWPWKLDFPWAEHPKTTWRMPAAAGYTLKHSQKRGRLAPHPVKSDLPEAACTKFPPYLAPTLSTHAHKAHTKGYSRKIIWIFNAGVYTPRRWAPPSSPQAHPSKRTWNEASLDVYR